jgi:DNA-directed RNA polymerase III subunit RPC1
LVAFDVRKSIRFSVLSGSEIRKSAEVQVWNNRIYDRDMTPVPNGLLDPRMVMPRSVLLFRHVYFH